jgi:hypothetical protein
MIRNGGGPLTVAAAPVIHDFSRRSVSLRPKPYASVRGGTATFT